MPETFAIRLAKLLEIKGLKAADLSRMTGIDKSRISRYLKGAYNARQDSLYLICGVTNVSYGWLMGLDVPMEPIKTTASGEGSGFDVSEKLIESFNILLSMPQETQEKYLAILDALLKDQENNQDSQE